jgi:hypothetical protein
MAAPRTTLHASGARRAAGRTVRRRRTTGGGARRRPSATPSRRAGPRNKGNWWSVALVVFGIVVAASWFIEDDGPVPAVATCALPGSAVTITPEQAANAATIAEVAWDRGLSDRAVVIALATAQQESGLRNIDYGDRDSLGLFQQRPSMGWGTEAQVQDPVYAAGKFLERLVQVPGWQTARLTDAAQTVQRSGFPEAYQKHEAMAIDLTAALRAGGGELDCG